MLTNYLIITPKQLEEWLNYKDIKQDVVITEYNFVGFPLEFGIHWFHSKKERYKVLFGLIPVGKPTSFGRGLGLKLYGINNYNSLTLDFQL